MTLTPEQIAEGWLLHDGSYRCPIKGDGTKFQVMGYGTTASKVSTCRADWYWPNVKAYRIIEAHGADAAPARPTPWPASYDELVWDDAGWSQTIIVDGKRPEWLRDDDLCVGKIGSGGWSPTMFERELAIRVRRREPKRETVTGYILSHHLTERPAVSFDLIDGKPDLATLKIAGDAL